MKEQEINFPNYLAALTRRKLVFGGVALGTFLLGALVAFTLPPVYRSTAIIQIEQQEIPQDLVRSTITSFADQRVQMMGQRIQSTTNLERIIKKFNLFPKEQRTYGLERTIGNTREAVSLKMISADVMDPRSGRPIQANIAFSLAFDYDQPEVAQKVANELVTLYLSENQKTRTKQATETATFLSEEANKQQTRIKDLELQLATFKEEHAGELPELMSLNLQLMQRTENQLMDVERQLRSLEERKIYLQSELSLIEPNLVIYGSDGKRIMGSEDRLRAMESEFTQLSSRYTDQHPDIVKLNREISVLREQLNWGSDPEIHKELRKVKESLNAAREKYSESHPDVRLLKRMIEAIETEVANRDEMPGERKSKDKPNNPAYIQLKAQLDAARTEVKSYKQERKDLIARLADYEDRLTQTPQVEKEYNSITREYESVLKEYSVTRARLMEAQLAESLERDHKGERFSIVEPPRLPERPISPNRPAILIIGLLLAVALGAAAVTAVEILDDRIHGTGDAKKLSGDGLLVTVPYIATERERRRDRTRLAYGSAGSVLLMFSTLAIIHFAYKPLDILWLLMMRKLGLS
jgi:uncharacterized protein involved in exopolysaccharide biosynthesis